MNKLFRFNFKLDAHDRDCLLWLAARLQRSQSDTVRWLLRQAAAGGGIRNYELGIRNGEKGRGGEGEKGRGPLPFEFDLPLGITGDWEEWGSGIPEDEGPR